MADSTEPARTQSQSQAKMPVGPSLVSMETLRQRSDFLRAARARRHSGPGFLLQARRREPDEPGGPRCIRIGYTCSRKIGNSVIRNRAKRRLRAIARAVLPALGQAGWDYVLVGRPQATVERDFAALQADLTQALQAIHRPRRRTATDGNAGPA